MTQHPLRRPATRTKVRGVLQMSLMSGVCDICKRHRSVGNHHACSARRQAKYRHLWESPNQGN